MVPYRRGLTGRDRCTPHRWPSAAAKSQQSAAGRKNAVRSRPSCGLITPQHRPAKTRGPYGSRRPEKPTSSRGSAADAQSVRTFCPLLSALCHSHSQPRPVITKGQSSVSVVRSKGPASCRKTRGLLLTWAKNASILFDMGSLDRRPRSGPRVDLGAAAALPRA